MSGASTTVLAVSGSLRRGSHNTRLLEAAARLLRPAASVVQFSGLEAVPPFNEDDEHEPSSAVLLWRAAIQQADGVLFATPEYNSSLPGQLKNAIDWASRPAGAGALRNKNVVIIGASTGMFGAVWAQAEGRKALASAGARVLERELAVPTAGEQFDELGDLLDDDLRASLQELLAAFLEEIRVTRSRLTSGQVSMGGTLL